MTHTFTLTDTIIPKARPRGLSTGRHYLPQNYRDWKNNAIWELRQQHHGGAIAEPVAIEIILIGKHSRRGDADNIAGAILDAMVQAGIIKDDNLTRIPSLKIQLIYSGEPPETHIKVEPYRTICTGITK
jgi:Holliday junction resolvase RusA-like endonuclease